MVFSLLRSMRPYQWTKNLFIFAGLIFSQNLHHGQHLLRTVLAFAIFCLLTGGVYILHDIIDVQADRLPPSNRRRPIAAGRIPLASALTVAVISVVIALICAVLLDVGFGLICALYLILMV